MRVLVATDRTEAAERAVAWAAELAARYEAELPPPAVPKLAVAH